MKVFLPKRAKDGVVGGGWSFTSNLIRYLSPKIDFSDSFSKSDIYFIPGPTLAVRDEVKAAKDIGKKIVLRIDNIPRNSRNRNTGTGRLYDFAQMADLVIYQSEWAKSFIRPFIKKDGPVILNGVDTKVFNESGKKIEKNGSPQYLYVRSSRDETKRWEAAWYYFQKEYFKNNKAHLWIVGKFSSENLNYNFDLFGGAEKRYKFFGMISDREEMAKIYRSVDKIILPYANEACSNTLLEAMSCGTEIIYNENEGGSIKEQINAGVITVEEMCNNYYKVFKEL